MRIFFASLLCLVAVACSSSQKQDEAPKDGQATGNAEVEASAKPEPVEVAGLDLSTPYKAIYHALRSARMENEEEAFQTYLSVLHPDEVGDEAAVQAMRENQWQRFRKQHDWFLTSEGEATYIISKMIPAELDDETEEVRIFVRDLVHKDNTPAEVVLRRHGKEWRIVSNSM